MKINKSKKGISLIVLVITIIVMIILAAAIILSLQSSGIIGKANEAKTNSDIANAKNLVTVELAEWKLNEDNLDDTTNTLFSVYAEEKLDEAGFKVTSKLGAGEDKTGSYEVTNDGTIYVYPKIPDGFVASNKDTEDQVSEGLVIYEGTESVKEDTDAQTTRNQFVWIPVNNINEFKRENFENYKDFDTQLTEPSAYKGSTAYQYPTEVAEYQAMYNSVEKYGGFYIGRYEAGITGATARTRTTQTSYLSDGTTLDVVVQKDKYVYNYVGWGDLMTDIESEVFDRINERYLGKGAVYLSQNMNLVNKSDVVSTLIYGVQWDSVVRFLSNEYAVINDITWGNYQKYNSKVDSTKQVTGAGSLQKTGYSEYWKAKNIYDISGNVWEWTMEAVSNGTRKKRGGSYSIYDGYGIAKRSYHNSSNFEITYYENLGFRVALYLI